MGAEFNTTPRVQNVDRSADLARARRIADAGPTDTAKQQATPATPKKQLVVSPGLACIKIWEEEQGTIETDIDQIKADANGNWNDRGPSDSVKFNSHVAHALQRCMDYGITIYAAEAAMEKAYTHYYSDPLYYLDPLWCRIHRMAIEHEKGLSHASVRNPICKVDPPISAKGNPPAAPTIPATGNTPAVATSCTELKRGFANSSPANVGTAPVTPGSSGEVNDP